jgi:hypothetical protein
MQWLIEDFLIDVARIFVRLVMGGNVAAQEMSEAFGRAVRRAILIAGAWLVLVVFTACMTTPYNMWWVMPLFAAGLPIVALFAAVMATNPHVFTMGTIVSMIPTLRTRAIRPSLLFLAKIIGLNLGLVIYLSLVPLCHNVKIVPLLIVFGFALAFFPKKTKWVSIVGIAVITIILWRGTGYATNAREGVRESVTGMLRSQHILKPANYYGGIADLEPLNYTEAPDEPQYQSFPIPLHPYGYNTHFWVPEFAEGYALALSQNKGDWVSVRCRDHKDASRIFYAGDSDLEITAYVNGCFAASDKIRDFWIQGSEGASLTVTVTSKKEARENAS